MIGSPFGGISQWFPYLWVDQLKVELWIYSNIFENNTIKQNKTVCAVHVQTFLPASVPRQPNITTMFVAFVLYKVSIAQLVMVLRIWCFTQTETFVIEIEIFMDSSICGFLVYFLDVLKKNVELAWLLQLWGKALCSFQEAWISTHQGLHWWEGQWQARAASAMEGACVKHVDLNTLYYTSLSPLWNWKPPSSPRRLKLTSWKDTILWLPFLCFISLRLTVL